MHRTLARTAPWGLVAAWLLSALPAPARAQFVAPPTPAAYALRNVTLVSAAGARRPGMDLVVRGDRIVALGPGLTVPPDAEVLAGDSLLVYPGIVDGWGAVTFAFPRDSVDRTLLRSWDPPRAVHGFLPHRRVFDVLAPTTEELAALRRKGVVAVAVHPVEGLMPGRGALLLLRGGPAAPGGAAPGAARLAIEPVLGPVLTFRGTRGFYPATGMAVPTFFRQAFLDATRAAQLAQATPRGAVPPPYDADHAVLQDVLAGRVPAFFVADDVEHIRHVLRFADAYRIRPILLGGAEAWQLAAELAQRDVPVLVSLDFPEPVRWKPDAKPDSAPLPAAVRERRDLEERYANAGRLAAAGVRVALTSGGKADIRAAARKAIEHGLREEDAVRAVTLAPAQLFGYDQLATVAEGAPATFIVTDGALFGERTKVRYTFVEGVLEPGDTASAAAADSAAATARDSIAGTWAFEAKAGAGDAIRGTMTLALTGTRLEGSVDMGELGTATIRSGSLAGNRIALNLAVTSGGQSLSIDLDGTVEGNTMSGTGTGPTGPFEWTATRTPEGAR